MDLQTIIEQWFEDNAAHEEELQRYIQSIKPNMVSCLSMEKNNFQELVTAITKQKMEEKPVAEHTNLKFHYTVGELEEYERITPIVDDFTHEFTNAISRMKTACMDYAKKASINDVAHELHAFFISTIMNDMERQCKSLFHRVEVIKNDIVNEQISLSISLITKEWSVEEETKLKEKQAYLVGKVAQLQREMDQIARLWNVPYGTSLYYLLNTMRMALYEHLSQNVTKKQTNA